MGNQLDDGISPSKLDVLTANVRCGSGAAVRHSKKLVKFGSISTPERGSPLKEDLIKPNTQTPALQAAWNKGKLLGQKSAFSI